MRCFDLKALALYLSILTAMGGSCFGQMAYFNEWYRPTQDYVKLKVAADSLYRVTSADLQAAGVPNVGALNRTNIQLFYRGQEVPVYVQDSLNGRFAFFEFLGRRNDGLIDTLLYRRSYGLFENDPSLQPNRFTSIFSDTSAYFLTWGDANAQSYSPISPSNFGAFVPEGSYRYRSLSEFTFVPFIGGGGATDIYHVLNPDYVMGEGFMSNEVSFPDEVARNYFTRGYTPAGNPSRVAFRAMGTNAHQEHILGIAFDQTDVFRDSSYGINIADYAFDYAPPIDSITKLRFRSLGAAQGTVKDKQSIAWLTITYDHDFDLRRTRTTVVRDWNHSDTTYMRFTRADVTTEAWIYDPVRQQRIAGTVSGDTLKFLVPGHPAPRDLHVYTDKAIAPAEIVAQPALHNVSDVNDGAEMVIITHRFLAMSAQQYANYRDTNTVNRLSTKVVYIDEIYDEFGYGSMTPWAIKNFCRYAFEQWTVKPKHILLWGKGRNCPKCNQGNQDNFVPTFGTPANDWEYVTNMDRNSINLVPATGLGRVSIYNDQQGLDYLDKVRDYEHQPYLATYKEALFMGGGKSIDEQNAIRSANVEHMMPILLGEPLQGKVYYYQKTNNGFESNTPNVTTEQHINAGLGILHYFGHSAVNIFELDILEPSRYTNYGRYPFMIAYGCSGGNFNEAFSSYGERMIAERGKGAIAYLGNTSSGFLHTLPSYGKALYASMFQQRYGASLGEIFQTALQNFTIDNLANQNIYAANHAKQLDLQGDPSIHLNFPQKPDLRVDAPDIFFPDGTPQAQASTFKMSVILHNDGRSFADSFVVKVEQQLPSGQTYVHDSVYFQPFANEDTLELTLPNPHGLLSAGTNAFTVRVDGVDFIDELENLTNNVASVNQLFVGSLATPIFPPEYAIVPSSAFFLQASMFVMNNSQPQRYVFEIDTASTFDSPALRASGPVTGTAALGQWPIGFVLTPGQVYYWRTRLADFYPEQWLNSSFKYVPGREGWSQSRLPQMTKDEGNGLALDLINRVWNFESWTSELHALIGGAGKATYFLGPYGSGGEAGSGVLYTVIDHRTLRPIVAGGSIYGDWQFTGAPPSASNHAGLSNVSSMIATMQPDDYFLMVSSVNPAMNLWPDWIIQSFEQVGANYANIRAMTNGERIILFGRKGAPPGSATVIIHPNLVLPTGGAIHDLLLTLSAPKDEASLQSTIIGPAATWQQLQFGWGSLDATAGDSMQVDVYGIDPSGTETLLIAARDSGLSQINTIQASLYPRLKLQANLKDHSNLSPPQLQQWEVYHTPVPDLAIDASLAVAIPDTIDEGQHLRVRVFVRNLTSIPTDSVWVRFALQKADRSYIELGRQRYGPFQALELKQIGFDANTVAIGLEAGRMTLEIEVNPGETMPEQYHFNNLYYAPIQVRTDGVGPIVDVTIDGRHLMGGDIVSPEPEIVIQINDDNPYLPVTVSDSTYRIWFGTERSYLSNPMVTIEDNDSIEQSPVRMPDNKSRLTFRPGRLPDGEYTLAVQAFDLKGNQAASRPYVIQMNVVNEKSISEVLPYPNPFSTACRFAFTLTGNEKPTRFDIEIYTVTGRLVKVVDLLAQDDVHFGYNITQYAWDGRDEYGDLLANGVYIYKVQTRFSNAGEVKMRDEGISTYFKNGFGKMYLMR